MSVRLRKWRSRKTGEARSCWEVHVVVRALDGREQVVRRKSPVQTRRGAEQYERQLRQALLDGSYDQKEVTTEIPTLKDFAKTFVDLYAVSNNKETEVVSKKSVIANYLTPALGNLRLNEIGVMELDRFKADMLAGKYASKRPTLSKKTVNNALACLSAMMKYALDAGFLDYTPRIRWLKVPEPDFDYLDFDESERLLAAADDEPEWAVAIFVGLRTGLRWGELFELRVGDVDLVKRRALVRRSFSLKSVTTPKNGKSRVAPLSKDTVARLKQHRHQRIRKGDLVFCQPDGERWTHRIANKALKRLCRKAGLREIGWHVLRHTFASHLAMRGVPLKAVQELLGHQSITMTMRYAHLAPAFKEEAVDLLDTGFAAIQENTGRTQAVLP